ncbi:hypothetical protein Gotur_022248 [Gossypium turneri]
MRLGLDVDIHKLEVEKLKKGKKKAEEDLDGLKTDYKKLRMSVRTAGLGKTSEQWQVSLSKIEELKGRTEELETALQNCELRVELLAVNNERWKEQFHRSQDQVR